MVSRFTWTQLMNWEKEAVKRRVPANVPGLIPRSMASNYKWIRRTGSYERNGERNIVNSLYTIRVGFAFFIVFCVYQMWRTLLWGWAEYLEHHNYNFDDIVYEKLSARNVPYHAPNILP